MVTILQLNRLELKEMVTQEIVQNPVLEESLNEPGDEITPEELLPLLEAENLPRSGRPTTSGSRRSERRQLRGMMATAAPSTAICSRTPRSLPPRKWSRRTTPIAVNDPLAEPPAATDPFDEIDFGSFFDDYLDPGYKSPGLGICRKALVRDLPLVAGHAGRSPALAVERQRHH